MGENLKIVARAILDDISNKKYPLDVPFKALHSLALTVQEKLGGKDEIMIEFTRNKWTPLYSIYTSSIRAFKEQGCK